MPDARETIIRIDHGEGYAEVWTPYPAIQRLMQRVGATPMERQIAGQWWRVDCKVLSRGIRFGKVGGGQAGKRTEAQIQSLAKARQALGRP